MLIVHGTLLTLDSEQRIVADGAVLLRGDRIAEIGSSQALLARHAGEELLDASGLVVMPGMICAHTHLYRTLARGLEPVGSDHVTAAGRLHDFWWHLASTLGYDELRYAALLSCIEAIRSGTTLLFDQHSSPAAVRYALDAIAEAMLQAGLRASLCYGVSDRLSQANGREGVDENARFARRIRSEPLLRASMGLDACLHLSDETLRAAVGAAGLANLGFHAIVGESMLDHRECATRAGMYPVERLRRWGILGERTLAVHSVHLSQEEEDLLARTHTWVVHNPRSNMLEAVGRAPVSGYLNRDIGVCLGTDGVAHDMFAEACAAYLLHRHAAHDASSLASGRILRMVMNNAALASRMFGTPVGSLIPGALADMILLDYVPGTPLSSENLAAHLVSGLEQARVDTTIVAGRVLMRRRVLTTIDVEGTTARARELVGPLWRRLKG